MKKEYSTPIVEKIAFNYRDQVVVASASQGGGENGDDQVINTSPKTNGWGSDTCGGAVWLTEFIPLIAGCIAD